MYIHFHDIFYPFEYPADWVFEGRAWNEAYLLRAFLEYNRAFEIQFFTSYMMLTHRQEIESDMPLCLKNPGGNIWLRKSLHDPVVDRVQAISQRKTRQFPSRIVPSQSEFGWLLGEGWYESERDHRWMAQQAAIRIAGPDKPGQHLRIHAFNPHVNGAQLSVTADYKRIGSVSLPTPGIVTADFPLPKDLVGQSVITIHMTVDQVYEVPGDPRRLGLSVTAIEIV